MQQGILICASGTPKGGGGTPNGGGTGCLDLIKRAEAGVLDAKVVGVLSDHEHGGVREKAEEMGVPFFHFNPHFSYQDALRESGATTTVFCGWRRDVYGLDPAQTVAIVRSGGGKEGYFDAHQYAASVYYREDVSSPEIIIRFVEGPTVNDGPAIIKIPVEIRVGSDFQLPQSPGKRGGDDPTFTGVPEERLARITKHWMREAQRFFGYQVLNQVLGGRVRYNGPGKPPICSETFEITRRWIEKPLSDNSGVHT